jgi:hypothetical protein
MKLKYVALVAAVGAGAVGVMAWRATRRAPDQSPAPASPPGEPVSGAGPGPAPALELVGRVEGMRAGLDGERAFNLRLARPDPPATESADAAYLRESIGVVHVRLRSAAPVTGAGPLREGQVVQVWSVRSQPRPTYPPTWFPDAVRVVSAAGAE